MKIKFYVFALILLPIILLAQSSQPILNLDDVVSKMTLEQRQRWW
jgi:hypothetical protein